MKIAMPTRILDRPVGGNTTYAQEVSRGLVARGHEILRIPAHAHPGATMMRETAYGLKGQDTDTVLHYVADTGPLVRTRTASVVTVHGVASRWIDGARSPLNDFVWRTRVSRAIASTDGLITVSHSSAADVAEVFDVDPADIHVIPHGIDVRRFSAPANLSEKTASAIGGRPFILYLGNIEPRKNIGTLIRAMQTPELKRSGMPLVIAGRPAWDYQEVMRLIEDAANVVYLGFVSSEDRVALMQSCTLFAFPSLYEGFGFPVLEALAAGAVVAASRRGSLEEVAGPALSFESLDSRDVARGIIVALSDEGKRRACIEEGRAWAQRFSWNRSVESHEAVYREVAASR
ncbi:hypothetical protein SCMU_28810 [Sinomonas cyclohexanicum]|uniref:D-inositol 3-phosphate glycosyltransferase n=1 Tax=Sinomonas cyclohexanicum TaxID=322009 RepID=A0ABM7PXL3_SINCY|nr:glycosyltransferase family 1 protein [Corynebacterium cyclohexanicum]BCT77039.1 hypothetical protein SCMU_28810 [Corynebacterium cyclohexanicum]